MALREEKSGPHEILEDSPYLRVLVWIDPEDGAQLFCVFVEGLEALALVEQAGEVRWQGVSRGIVYEVDHLGIVPQREPPDVGAPIMFDTGSMAHLWPLLWSVIAGFDEWGRPLWLKFLSPGGGSSKSSEGTRSGRARRKRP